MIATLMLALAAPVAVAQSAEQAPVGAAPVGPDPATTTATYGEWVLRCQAAPAAATAKRICEVVQTMQRQGQQEPVAQVAFGKAPGSSELHIVVALPVNVTFPSTVQVGAGDTDPRPLDLVWKRCLPGACFADAVASPDAVTRWRGATTAGRVRYQDATTHEVALPLSFRGLAPALDALNKAP